MRENVAPYVKFLVCASHLAIKNVFSIILQEELLEIKELPVSNERPECLSEKYDR